MLCLELTPGGLHYELLSVLGSCRCAQSEGDKKKDASFLWRITYFSSRIKKQHEPNNTGSTSPGQSGDGQGLPDNAEAESESVKRLVEEGSFSKQARSTVSEGIRKLN